MILGPCGMNEYPPVEQAASTVRRVRKRLDLFANIRPAQDPRRRPAAIGVPVDLLIVRENTEGFYADRNMFVGSASSCRRPTSRCRCARSRGRAAYGSRRPRSNSPCAGERRSQPSTRPTCCGYRKTSSWTASRGRRALSRVAYEEVIVDAMAASWCASQPLPRGRHHQYVRRHPLRFGAGDFRQPRARGLDQARRRSSRGAGAARLRPRRRRAGPRRSDLADRFGGDAARLACDRRKDNHLHAAPGHRSALDRALADPQGRTRDISGPLGTEAFGERVAAMLDESAARG